MLTWGSIASSLAAVASNPKVVSTKNDMFSVEKAMPSSSHARGYVRAVYREPKTTGRDITPTRPARQMKLHTEKVLIMRVKSENGAIAMLSLELAEKRP